MSARQSCGHVDVWTSPLCVTPRELTKNPGIMRKLRPRTPQNPHFQGAERPQTSTRVHITMTSPYDKETFSKGTYYLSFLRETPRGRHVDVCGHFPPKNPDSSTHRPTGNPGIMRKLRRGHELPQKAHVHMSTVHTALRGTA